MSEVFIDSITGDLKYQGTSGTPAILAEGNGAVHLIPATISYVLTNGVQISGTNAFEGIGTRELNPNSIFDGNSKISRTIVFRVLLESTPGVTAEVRLFNLDAGSVVSSTTLTSSSSIPELKTASLFVGTAPNLVNSSQNYEVQLRISSPISPTNLDRAICKMAEIVFNYS
jgi:hypothetical protein